MLLASSDLHVLEDLSLSCLAKLHTPHLGYMQGLSQPGLCPSSRAAAGISMRGRQGSSVELHVVVKVVH